MSGIEIGKAAASASAWAWKLLENPFTDFLKRRWEDAKSDSEKAQYVRDRWNEFDWGKAAERYKERMKANYGHIRVLGTTEPKSLDDLFTDVNILEKPQAFRRYDLTQLHELQKEPEKLWHAERTPGLRVVVQDRGHRLYIMGGPGAGKTTFLRYLVHQTMNEDWGKIPIFITIKEWADSTKSVLDFIIEQFDKCQFPNAKLFIEYILEIGQAVILFDGLDEVKQEGNLRAHITLDLHNFSKKYSKTQIIVTCRVAASDYSFTEFTYVEISDFTDGQIKSYSFKWFGKDIKKAEQFLKELKKPDNKGVRDLGRSPLLLSLICLAYDETLTIPQRRVELYEEALDALLKKWDAARNIQRDEIQQSGQADIYKRLSLGRKKQMFARIATETFEKGEIFFHQHELAHQIEAYFKNLPNENSDYVDGEVILRAIEAQHGILTERAQDIFSFSHLTFQEYYTARYIVDNAPRTFKPLVEHIMDSRWREVFLLTASLLDEADDIFPIMQAATSYELQKNKMLIEIQGWVESKANTIKYFYPPTLRFIYWNFLFEYSDPFKYDSNFTLDFASELDFNMVRIIYRDKDYRLSLKRALISGQELANNRELHVNMDPIIEHLRSETSLSSSDRAAFNQFASLRARRRDLVNTIIDELHRVLEHLSDQIRFQIDINRQPPDDAYKSMQKLYYESTFISLLAITKILAFTGHLGDMQPILSEFNFFYKSLQHGANVLSETFGQKLAELSPPIQHSSQENWSQFDENIRNLIIDYFGMNSEWRLNDIQRDILSRFFIANELVYDCLKVAYVYSRGDILSKILTV